jgi:hypothetical protein
MALTMTLPQDVHCPIASNNRENINTTTSPDLHDAPFVALQCKGLVPLIERIPTTKHQQPKICKNFCTTFYDSMGYDVCLAKDYFQHASTMEVML